MFLGWFLMVLQGLNNKNVQEIMDRHVDSERTAEEIAQSAKRKGSQDDITALVIELEEW